MAYDLGDTVALGVDVVDDAGRPAAAGSVTLVIVRPDGTPEPDTIPTSPTVGRYEYSYVPTQVGVHRVQWASTAPATAYDDVIDVRAAESGVVSLVDAKQHLNKALGVTADDEELRPMIAAAVERVARHLGRPIGATPSGLEVLAVKMVLTDFWRTQRARTHSVAARAGAVEADSGVAGLAPLKIRLTDLLGPAAESGDNVPAPLGSFPASDGWPDPAVPALQWWRL